MRIFIGAGILILFALSSMPARAQTTPDTTVQGLYQMCKETAGDTDEMICIEYVSGIGDYMSVVGTARKDPQLGICGKPSYGAMIQAFNNWAEKHPEQWAKDRVIGVGTALRETWPCVAKNSN